MLTRILVLGLFAGLAAPTLMADKPPIEVSSPHFTLVTASSEKDARHILDNFERMRWMFRTLFPKVNADPGAPILVLAVRNKKEFQSLEPAEYLAKGQLNLAGYFLSNTDRNFILLRLDGESEHPFSTVYHEYTHLQFRTDEDWMPLWLNEGIAEFFRTLTSTTSKSSSANRASTISSTSARTPSSRCPLSSASITHRPTTTMKTKAPSSMPSPGP